jgi:hypothetical protein
MAGTYTYQDGLDEGKAEVDEVLAAAVRAMWTFFPGMPGFGLDSCEDDRCLAKCDHTEVDGEPVHAPTCLLLAAARVLGLEGATE